jgi:error-prone DNA polymerase
VDVLASDWDCTMEPDGESAGGFALRMGLRYVRGLGQGDWQKIAAARTGFYAASQAEFVRRSRLDAGALQSLAESGAFGAFQLNRRQSLWDARGLRRNEAQDLALIGDDPPPAFADLTQGEEIRWDYRTLGHSPRGHPLQPLREALRSQGLPDARAIAAMPHGRRVRYAGVVICRQCPATAGGVTFMTLEDETGFVNAVLWRDVFEAYPALAKATRFLGITGTLQVQGGVVHLVAEKLWTPKGLPEPPGSPSRDFR